MAPNLPFLNASISVGRNGADAGMVKTRGLMSESRRIAAKACQLIGVDSSVF
jgi:hypothetical protein